MRWQSLAVWLISFLATQAHAAGDPAGKFEDLLLPGIKAIISPMRACIVYVSGEGHNRLNGYQYKKRLDVTCDGKTLSFEETLRSSKTEVQSQEILTQILGILLPLGFRLVTCFDPSRCLLIKSPESGCR